MVAAVPLPPRYLEAIAGGDDFRAAAARARLLPFVQEMFPGYVPAPHHALIAQCLHAVEAGAISRLLVMLPPRHGKSELCSVHFPAWYLGRNPGRRVIACSYSAALAYRFSRRARNLLTSARWPFEARPAGDLAQVQSWDIEGTTGGYVAAGVGGSITGVGCSVLLIDDPTRNAADAESATIRESTWDWYTSTAYTRLEPGGAVIVVGTRWHDDDLLGRIVAQAESGADQWVVVSLPALSEGPEVAAEVTLPASLAERQGLRDGETVGLGLAGAWAGGR